jgi:hypothetical protein
MRVGVAVVSAACAFGIWPSYAKAEPSPQADAPVASSPSGHDANNWFPAEAAAPATTHPEADSTSDEPKHVDGGVSLAPRASSQEPQSPAQAPNALTRAPAAPVVFRRSYGWQIVVADVVSVSRTRSPVSASPVTSSPRRWCTSRIATCGRASLVWVCALGGRCWAEPSAARLRTAGNIAENVGVESCPSPWECSRVFWAP